MKLTTLRPMLLCAVALGAGCAGKRTTDARGPAASDQQSGAGAQSPAATIPTSPEQMPKLRLSDAVVPLEYRLELGIDPDEDRFDGSMTIDLELRKSTSRLWLNGSELEIRRATLTAGGKTWELEALPTDSEDVIGFDLKKTVAAGKATLAIDYQGLLSDKEGSGAFRQRDGESWYVFTQFEPISARRAFPCFDEPRFKVPWQLTIHAREGHMALTNTPVIEETPGPAQGLKTYRFASSKPMSSYLIAFAVGPFETVDLGKIGKQGTPARIVVPRGHTEEARYAASVTPEILSRLEAYFDSAYPYEKLDSIAIPQFGGAMEHPGLITYSAALLLSSPKDETIEFRRAYAGVAAHELAHQWFGNLVTMAWWDDIWLNESFATWMAAKITDEWKPEWDGEIQAVRRASNTMSSDSLISARRIRQPIESRHDIISAFDAISYGKGAAVLSMFERWVGKDKFQAGVRAYMTKHAWGTATAADFLAAIATVSQPEVPKAFRTFLDQSGVPVLSADLTCEEGQPPTLDLAQERYLPMGSEGSSTDRTWMIPVCVKYAAGEVHEQCILLAEETDSLVLDKASRCPDWVLANAGAAGYYRVAYAGDMRDKLLKAGSAKLSVAERVKLVDDIQALVTAGNLELGDALALTPTLVADKSDHVVASAVDMVDGMSMHLVPEALEPNYTRFVRKAFGDRARKLGWRARPNENEQTKLLRRSLLELVAMDGQEPALIQEASKLARTWLDRRTGVDPELLGLVLRVAGRYGDKALHERIEQAIVKTADLRQRRALIGALAQATDPERVKKNLAFYMSGKIDIREAGMLLWQPLSRRQTRQMVYDFVKEQYDVLAEKLSRQGRVSLIFTAGSFCDQEHLDDAKAFFGPKADDMPGGPKALAQTLERIQLCMTARTAQQRSVEAFLKKH